MDQKLLNPITNLIIKNKWTICFLGILPLLAMLIAIIFFYNQTLQVFPVSNIGDRLFAMNDSIWQGNSEIEEFAYNQKSMKLKYRLKEGFFNPMVFFSLMLGSAAKPFDLSDCDSITLQIKEATPKRVLIFVKTFLPGVSRIEPTYAETLRHNQYNLQLNPGHRQYTIKLKDLATQSWWLERVKLNQELLPAETFHKVISFDMQFNLSSSDYRLNKHESITIEKIFFHRKPSLFCYGLMGLAVIYIGWLTLVLIHRSPSQDQPLLPQGKPLEVTTYREKELLQVKEFITANYGLADISTRMIAQQLGLSQARVNELIKEEYQLTFKQLINKLRIEEAKRLLKETDLRITEIAFNIGFNNATYFNNLFRYYEQTTPSEYREKMKGTT